MKGEIYIAGRGVARGYWNLPEHTAERFLPDPFSEVGGELLYRSGDLAFYRNDGTIMLLGRQDHQVKIRGHRIELGEVEAALLACRHVRQAAVVVQQHGPDDKRLVGYVLAEGAHQRLKLDVIKEELRTKLPDYMIPAAIVQLDVFPLTPNGKLNVKALPKPEQTTFDAELLPSSEIEVQLAMIWEDLLNISNIGTRQSFFDLGGHSLLVVKLIRKIKEQFGAELPFSAIFEDPTIEHLGRILRKASSNGRRSNLVPLQRHGSRTPLFFVHPGGGGALAYKPLASLLGEEQPVYAFQAIDEEENSCEDLSSIEQRAAHYLHSLKQVQPSGPYLLGGWSFGGFVAYEMAQQLHRQGEQVASLILLDIIAETPSSPPQFRDEAEQLLLLFNEMRELDISLHDVEHAGKEERLHYLLDRLREMNLLTPEVEISQVRSFLKGLTRRNESLTRYKLLPYSGNTVLIRAQAGRSAVDGTGIDPEDPTLGFGKLCAGNVAVHFVPGTHYDLLRPPHVLTIAQVITNCLKENVDLARATFSSH